MSKDYGFDAGGLFEIDVDENNIPTGGKVYLSDTQDGYYVAARSLVDDFFAGKLRGVRSEKGKPQVSDQPMSESTFDTNFVGPLMTRLDDRESLRRALGDSPSIVNFVLRRQGPEVASVIWPDKVSRYANYTAAPGTPMSAPADVIVAGDERQGEGPTPLQSLPPPEDPSPVPDQSPGGDAKTGGDPVILFSGQLYYQVVDLDVAGRGLNFRLVRTYAHQARYRGPLGHCWDHSYNLWLREEQELTPDGRLVNVVYRSNGQVREDRYEQADGLDATGVGELSNLPDAAFSGPPGFFDLLSKSNGRYSLVRPDGITFRYGPDLQVERIEDLNGNVVTLAYDAERRLDTVTDPVGKRFLFRYDDLNRLREVRDEEGRRSVLYTLDDVDDLVGVDLWPDGESPCETDYVYAGPYAAIDLQHNLLRVLNPFGQVVMENAYGEDTDAAEFNRVTWQRLADGEFAYAYGIPDDPSSAGFDAIADRDNFPWYATIVRDTRGQVVEHWFNRQGNVVLRKVLEPAGAMLPATFRYNADGSLVDEQRTDGTAVRCVYGREIYEAAHGSSADGATAQDRLTFGRLHRRIHEPMPTAGETRRIAIDYEYNGVGDCERQRGPYFVDPTGLRLPGQPDAEVRYSYDARRNLVAIAYANLEASDGTFQPAPKNTFTYDAHGNLLTASVGAVTQQYIYFPNAMRSGFVAERIEDSSGLARRTRYDVDTLGRIVEVRGPYGAVDRRTWSGADLCIATVRDDPGRPAVRTEATYTRNRQLAEVIEPVLEADGSTRAGSPLLVRYTYDGYGRLTGWDVGGRVTTQTVGVDGRVERRTDPVGRKTQWQYDAFGRLVAVTRGHGTAEAATRRIEYRRGSDVAAMVDAEGARTTFLFDAFGRPAGELRPDGVRLDLSLDAAGRVVREVLAAPDPVTGVVQRHAETRYERDGAGRVIRQHHHLFGAGQPVGERILTRRFDYDEGSRIVREEAPDGAVVTSAFDGLGRLVRMVDADQQATTWTYDDALSQYTLTRHFEGEDANGAPAQASVAETFRWGPRGELVAHSDAAGAASVYERDSRGAVTRTRHETGADVVQAYSLHGDLVQVTQSAGALVSVVKMERDAVGGLARLTDPNGAVIDWTYDALGRRVAERRGAAVRSFAYDREGRLVHTVDETGVVVDRRYSPVGQLSSVSGADIGVIAYSYDPRGPLASAVSPTSSVTVELDSLGRPVRETADGDVTTAAYADNGALLSLTDPDGRSIAFDRSPAGRLLAVRQTTRGTAWPGNANAPSLRNLFRIGRMGDRITYRQYESCVQRIRHDAAGRAVAATWAASLASEWRTFGARMLDVEQVDDALRAYAYDALGRLVAARDFSGVALPAANDPPVVPQVTADVELDYALDANGNRSATTRKASGNPPEQTPHVVGPYDTYQQIGAAAVVHDATGRLRSVANALFDFDSLGRLIRAGSPTGDVTIAYDALGRVRLLGPPGAQATHRWFGGTMTGWRGPGADGADLAHADGLLIHVARGGADYVPLADLGRSIVGWVDDNGGRVATRRYGPFGESPPTVPWPAPFGYRGGLLLNDRDLYLMSSRAYLPALGRFLQRDPAGYVDGTNLYTYALGAPTIAMDPTGLASTEIDAGTVAWSAAKTAAIGIGVGVGVGATLVFAGIPLIIGAAAMLITGFVMAYANREEQAIRAGKGDQSGDIALAALGDMAFGATSLHEAVTGREAVTDRTLGGQERSERYGGVVGGIAAVAVGGKVQRLTGLSPPGGPRPRWSGFTAAELADADAMNANHIWRGGAGQRGVAVFRVRTDRVSPEVLNEYIEAVKMMDMEAGMRPYVASGDAARLRPIGDAAAAVFRESDAVGLPEGWHAGHVIDTRGGGDPLGPITGLPAGVNLSLGGQWRRYQPGFRFDGFTLVEYGSNKVLHPSMAFENNPGEVLPPFRRR